jgi:hypothetical protein
MCIWIILELFWEEIKAYLSLQVREHCHFGEPNHGSDDTPPSRWFYRLYTLSKKETRRLYVEKVGV